MNDKLMIAAAGTSEGKTLVALAIAALLARRGVPVQPFKVGPDYIDARLYESVSGKIARNVDLWLDGPPAVATHVERAAEGHVAIFEGMMGLFDGDDTGQTSSAHVARLLDVPVILVIDLWRMSQTAAAIALGCSRLEPRVRIAGVILNRTGGAAHEAAVRRAISTTGIPVLGVLPYRPHWQIPERHLGLDTTRSERVAAIAREVADVLEQQLDLDLPAAVAEGSGQSNASVARAQSFTIAVANDEALWFTYPETLEALEQAGARIARFSPMRDAMLPRETRGLWLGGGYPELHAGALAENSTLRGEVASAVANGMPVYAECGGMMYLAQELETPQGRFPMCGALAGSTSIAQPHLQIGYREVQVVDDSVCDSAGSTVRAYEFHYATSSLNEEPAYELAGKRIGARRGRTVASFLHRHFLRGDAAVQRFAEQCCAY